MNFNYFLLFIIFLKEKILLEVMFEVPKSDITCVKIDDQVVLGKKEIEFVRKSPSSESSSNGSSSGNGELNESEKSDAEQQSKAKTYA